MNLHHGLAGLLCVLLTACGGDGENNPAERGIPEGGVWYESDF
ncbi:MAG: hypothetical protein R3F53_04260 [Gammaproteobacteria bacterium]